MMLPKRTFEARVAKVAVAVCLALLAAPAAAAAAPIDDARAKVEEAQRAADAAAVRYEEAVDAAERLAAQIADLEAKIAAGRQQAGELRALARQRAVRAYTGRGTEDGTGFLIEGGDPLDVIRQQKLLARTKAREDHAAADLADLTDRLDDQRRQLEDAKAKQAQALQALETEQTTVQAQLMAAQQALTALEEELRRQEEEARAREIAASIARSASSRNNGRDYSGAFVVTGIVCPIRGAVSFVDSWGAPRHQGSHQGVDLMAARGTPNVAVVSGNVSFRSGGTSGNGAYLNGDDGNLYYYFHLDSYEGGARHVAQGEVIGYTGNTGDAQYTATHTHFEIHPNGGAAVNPYPSVRAVC
jgi:murein DD-endopeptidase MepM/ murein hydrolase activator NlpD